MVKRLIQLAALIFALVPCFAIAAVPPQKWSPQTGVVACYDHTGTLTDCGGGGGGGVITIAAGGVASGAYLSGSLSSGAVVDLTNVETTAGGSDPSKGIVVQGFVTGGTPLSVKQAAGSTLAATSTVTSPTNTPTISTSAYTAGYLFALPMSFTVTAGGAVSNAYVTLNTGTYTGGFEFMFFNAALTGSYTANTALALTQTDMGKFVGALPATDCHATATAATFCQVLYASQFFKLPSGTTIYLVPVINAAATFTNATDAVFGLTQVQ